MGVKVAGTEFSVDRIEIYPKDILANIYFIFWYSNKKTRGWTLSMAVTHILFVVEVLRTRNCYASILLKFVRQYMILVCFHFTEICRTRCCYMSISLKFVEQDIATCPLLLNKSKSQGLLPFHSTSDQPQSSTTHIRTSEAPGQVVVNIIIMTNNQSQWWSSSLLLLLQPPSTTVLCW